MGRDADELSALRRLYPNLSDQELEEARKRLDEYAALAIRISQKIESDPNVAGQLKLFDEKKTKI